MQAITKGYRQNYTGENIVTSRTYSSGVWADITEYVPNSVTNNQISNKAVVIGNGLSREPLDLQMLKNPMGLLGTGTVQTYGCNALYRDFNPDFLVAKGNDIIKEIADSGYTDNNIVYTSAIHLLEYPNKFYLIPNDPYTDAGTTAVYLACFDGHKQVYMIGVEGQDTPGFNYNLYAGTNGYDPVKATVSDHKWVADKRVLFDIYSEVDFVWVTMYASEQPPELWKYANNFRLIHWNQFALEVDL